MKSARLLMAAALFSVVAPDAPAQGYPSKPIRLIVPFAPAGGTDIMARVIAAQVSESLGKTIVVDNRPGAGGIIGTETVVRANPDGYTLIMVNSNFSASGAIQKLSYDPVKDVEPIVLIGETGLLLAVNPSLPVKSVKDLVAHAKANPGKLNYGSVGAGSLTHLSLELFKLETHVDITHVPYKGGSLALTATVSGEVQLTAVSMVPTIPLVKTGRLRAIAVTTGKRSSLLPEVPPSAKRFPVTSPFQDGVWGPKKLPKAIVARWNKEVAKVLQSKEMKIRLAAEGLEPAGGPPEQFMTVIRRDVEKWQRVVKQAKITAGN